MPSYTSSGCGIKIPTKSSKKALYSFGQKIRFLENWLQYFDDNYQNIIAIYKSKMSELFKRTQKALPPQKVDDYKEKTRQQSGQ